MIKDLRLVIFQPPVLDNSRGDFERFYNFWKTNWMKANVEMGKSDVFPSDSITRQHEILALFSGDKPIAHVCHRYGNLADPSTFDDSFFAKSWSSTEIDFLRGKGGLAAMGSQIAIDPQYRKHSNDIGLKYLITFLSAVRVEQNGVDAFLGMMRVDRGMEKVVYTAGAQCLRKDAQYFETKVDLIAFFPKEKPITVPQEYQFQILSMLRSAAVTTPFFKAA